MNSDRELLELAAKAAGLECDGESRGDLVWFDADRGRMHGRWNPLLDGGDALWLAARLGMNVSAGPGLAHARAGDHFASEHCGTDPVAAICRAIVRAAAEIGRSS
jgi:hypothetical protein